jgi:hypothetical protein
MYEYRQDVDIQVVCLGLGGVVSSGGSSRTAREEDDDLDGERGCAIDDDVY